MADYLRLPKARSVMIDVPMHKRLFSFVIDYLVIDFFIISYFVRAIGNIIPTDANFGETWNFIRSNPGLFGEVTWILAVLGMLTMTYFIYSQMVLTQTIGMKLMNLKLMDESKKDIKFWQVLVRNIFLVPVFPFVLLWIIDPVYIMIYNRKFSDVLARLRLVEEKTL